MIHSSYREVGEYYELGIHLESKYGIGIFIHANSIEFRIIFISIELELLDWR